MEVQSLTIVQGLRRLFDYFPRRRRWQGLLLLVLMFVGAVAELLTIGAVLPFLALIANPEAAQNYPRLAGLLAIVNAIGGDSPIVGFAVIFSIIAVSAAAVRILLAWVSQKFAYRLGHDLGVAVYERMLHQPYSFHVAHNTSQIISGIGKVQSVVGSLLVPILLGLSGIVITLFIFTALLFINAAVALASGLGFGLIYLFVSIATRKRLRRNSQVIAQSQTERVKVVQEGLGGIRDVLIDRAQPIYLRKFDRIDSRLRDAQAMNALIGATPRFVVEGAGMVMIAILALILSSDAGGLTTALPVLGALALGAQRLLPLLQQIYNGWTQIMGSRATFFDVLEMLERPMPADARMRGGVEPLPFDRSIRIDRVSFRYSEDGPLVLRDVDIDIPKGSRIGFIGKTGSGKSTIMDLVMGLLDPTAGEIRIDGVPVRQHRPGWQFQIAHVPQSIYLSDASIAENIAFGVEPGTIDRDRLREAAKRADIDDFIQTLPDGYQTHVGERGIRLSGGQRQRIGIARALYKQSKVLIFDEATSALDDATEAAIMSAIDRLGRDLTVLMIAHRLSTVRNCDRIYRLSNGRIETSGSFDEVMSKPRSKVG